VRRLKAGRKDDQNKRVRNTGLFFSEEKKNDKGVWCKYFVKVGVGFYQGKWRGDAGEENLKGKQGSRPVKSRHIKGDMNGGGLG